MTSPDCLKAIEVDYLYQSTPLVLNVFCFNQIKTLQLELLSLIRKDSPDVCELKSPEVSKRLMLKKPQHSRQTHQKSNAGVNSHHARESKDHLVESKQAACQRPRLVHSYFYELCWG